MYIFHFDLAQEMRGGQKQLLYLASYQQSMLEQGNSVYKPIILCPKNSVLYTKAKEKNLEIWPLPSRNFANPSLFFSVRQAIKHIQPAFLHSHEARAATLAYYVKKFFAPGAKLVHTRRVSYLIKHGRHATKYLASDALVCVSQEIADLAIEMSILAQKVRVVHSGVEPSLYLERLQRNDQRFVFVSVGALTKQKGYEVLLTAMQIIEKMQISSLPAWEVRIVGAGDMFNYLLEMAHSLGISERIAFLGYQDSRNILPNCDSLVSASVDGEGSSGVIKEAFAVGLPVICTDLESNKELVTDQVNGLMVQKSNAEALAGAMLRIMQENDLDKSLVKNGKIQLENFTVNKMGQAYQSIYDDLLD